MQGNGSVRRVELRANEKLEILLVDACQYVRNVYVADIIIIISKIKKAHSHATLSISSRFTITPSSLCARCPILTFLRQQVTQFLSYMSILVHTGRSPLPPATGRARCHRGFRCSRGSTCSFMHTSEEQEYFKHHGGRGMMIRAVVCLDSETEWHVPSAFT
jgi:hypothetical protein